MNRKGFIVVCALLTVFVGYAVIAGNRLPAELRKQIQTEHKQLVEAKTTIDGQHSTVAAGAAVNPELFRVRNFNTEWPGRFQEATVALTEAQRYDSRLQELLGKNSRGSQAEIQDLLKRETERRDAALKESAETLQEAQMRVNLKRDFPQTLAKVESSAQTLANIDYAPLTTKVQKAEQDWPSKKDILQARLDALLTPRKQAAEWQTAAKSLETKPAAQLTTADYAQALDLEESVAHAPAERESRDLASMTNQLYTSWDNILDDLDKENGGYRERVKHVLTTVPAPTEKGVTTSTETWASISPEQWRGLENNIGMTVAHKPLGRFDSEADNTPQPAGFAYMASPAEGRNQYGYWDNRGGTSIWTWLPEYLILRDLLSPRYYQPIPSYEWGRYQQAQRYGQTYYGRDESSGAPKYGSHGTFTARSYANSRYVQSGGFSSSKYTSGGGFSGSKYGSGPGASSPSASSGQRFGSSGSSSAPKRFGGSSGGHSYGSSRSAGRSFGGRRR